MKISELIEQLQKYEPDGEVIIHLPGDESVGIYSAFFDVDKVCADLDVDVEMRSVSRGVIIRGAV